MLAVQRISSCNHHTHIIRGGSWGTTLWESFGHETVSQIWDVRTVIRTFILLFLLLVIKICQAICKEVHCTYLTFTQKETHKYKNWRPFLFNVRTSMSGFPHFGANKFPDFFQISWSFSRLNFKSSEQNNFVTSSNF